MTNFAQNIAAFENIKTKPKAIVFDWDNTLADTWPLIHRALNKALTAFDKEEWSLEKVKNTIHKSMRESFPSLFGNDWQEAGKIYIDSYAHDHLQHLKLLSGAMDLLKAMKEKNVPAFLVSNKIGTTLRKEINNLELNDYFYSVIGAMDADSDKPNTDPVDLALQGFDYSLNDKDIWFIGDTIADIDCGLNCGFTAVAFSSDKDFVSKSITERLDQDNYNNLPLFFDHEDLIRKI